MNIKSKILELTDEQFVSLINQSNSISEVLEKIGLSSNGSGSRSVIKRRIKALNIDCSQLYIKIAQKRRDCLKKSQTKLLEDIFSGKCEYVSTNSLKKRLIREGILEYKCNSCGISEWNKQPISLQLDHIDGNKKNNSKDNLRILCPNCHSQTITYAGKRNGSYRTVAKFGVCKKCNKSVLATSNLCLSCNGIKNRKTVRPTKEDLEKIIWETPTTKLKIKFGVSDVAISKWCKIYGIKKPPRGYWQKQASKK